MFVCAQKNACNSIHITKSSIYSYTVSRKLANDVLSLEAVQILDHLVNGARYNIASNYLSL